MAQELRDVVKKKFCDCYIYVHLAKGIRRFYEI